MFTYLSEWMDQIQTCVQNGQNGHKEEGCCVSNVFALVFVFVFFVYFVFIFFWLLPLRICLNGWIRFRLACRMGTRKTQARASAAAAYMHNLHPLKHYFDNNASNVIKSDPSSIQLEEWVLWRIFFDNNALDMLPCDPRKKTGPPLPLAHYFDNNAMI